jgi:enterochelin esterase-like enzyme
MGTSKNYVFRLGSTRCRLRHHWSQIMVKLVFSRYYKVIKRVFRGALIIKGVIMKINKNYLRLFVLYVVLIFYIFSCKSVVYNKETSNTDSERLKKIIVKSKALQKEMRISVWLPYGYSISVKYPVLYLLHGYSHTEENWFSVVGAHITADRLVKEGKIIPFIIVAPQYDNSFGFNLSDEPKVLGGDDRHNNFNMGRYEDWLLKEMILYIDANFNTIASRDSRFIGGQSMGGYAALRLAFKHPELFGKVGGHMPVVKFIIPDKFLNEKDSSEEFQKKIGNPIDLALTAEISNLKVYLDAGDQDKYRTYDGCEKLYSILKSRNIKSEYHFNKGDHSSAYVKTQIENYLVFYGKK